MPRRAKTGVTIRYRKLGKERAKGQYIAEGALIEIDSRLTGSEHLEILIHESLHALQPHHEEETVARDAANLAHILWADGYRKLETTEFCKLGKKVFVKTLDKT